MVTGMLPVVLGLLAASPVSGRFLMTVEDVPLAELRFSLEGRTYTYESTHFLEEGDKARRLTFTLDAAGLVDGLVPEVLALARRPAPGCREVLEEVTRAREKLCIEDAKDDLLLGRLDDVPLTARYAKGRLVSVELPAVTWTASDEPAKRSVEQPFVDGYPVEGAGAKVTLAPRAEGVTVLSRAPLGVGTPQTVGRVRCLVAARKALEAEERARGAGAQLVLGVVLEEGRAWQHAWFRRGEQHFDPSVLPGDAVLAARTYVAFPRERAGRLYLELLDGRRVVRRER